MMCRRLDRPVTYEEVPLLPAAVAVWDFCIQKFLDLPEIHRNQIVRGNYDIPPGCEFTKEYGELMRPVSDYFLSMQADILQSNKLFEFTLAQLPKARQRQMESLGTMPPQTSDGGGACGASPAETEADVPVPPPPISAPVENLKIGHEGPTEQWPPVTHEEIDSLSCWQHNVLDYFGVRKGFYDDPATQTSKQQWPAAEGLCPKPLLDHLTDESPERTELTANDICFLSGPGQEMTFVASDVSSLLAWTPPGTPDRPMIWDVKSSTVLDTTRNYPMMKAESFFMPLPSLRSNSIPSGMKLRPLSNRWSSWLRTTDNQQDSIDSWINWVEAHIYELQAAYPSGDRAASAQESLPDRNDQFRVLALTAMLQRWILATGLQCSAGLTPEHLYALMSGLPGGADGASRDPSSGPIDAPRYWLAPPRPDLRSGTTWVLADSC